MSGANDRQPTLAAADLHAQIRETAFALLLIDQRSVDPSAIGRLVGLTGSAIAPLLDELNAAGWMDRDPAGRVTGSGGLSLTDGPHRLCHDSNGLPDLRDSDRRGNRCWAGPRWETRAAMAR